LKIGCPGLLGRTAKGDAPCPPRTVSPSLLPEITAWRRDFHEHPELLFDVHRTAAKVAELLPRASAATRWSKASARPASSPSSRARPTPSGRVIGLRADMDALPIIEQTGVPYASKTPGKMHACGHDGHTAMLLGAAKYLAETRNFDGTAVCIFQPAEEGGGGGSRDRGRHDGPLRHRRSLRHAQHARHPVGHLPSAPAR
jgi:metal-dependent amidase/aminoacylase/carboxypeptidase family protein